MSAVRAPFERPASGKARRTFDALVVAARGLLVESGAITAESVAARAGVAPATFYAYFASKDDCLAAAFDVVLHENNEVLARSLSIERLLDEGLDATLQALVMEVVNAFRVNAMVFRAALARLPESKTIRDVYRRDEQEGLEVVRRFLELGAAAGRVRSGDLDVLATVLLVTLEGFNNRVLFSRIQEDGVVEGLVAMMGALLSP